ncbi:Lrp/AsnC family transcriptional regulator [Gordonia jinhuaensis]|uniref:Lrp/AsnC family transcriptional regulator n=1 Tax=Gordonia jinhuaensis TaxID=1517702 RepID=UPI00166F20EE|nr:Lrp/AsnC family transcriptional regulator [Gordonia jinhuaensis]
MDPLQERIVAELRSDGRLGAVELADRLGISRTTASKRLAALVQSSRLHIVGVIHPHTLGFTSLAHVSIATDTQAQHVSRQLAGRREIPFVTLASGSYPVIAEVRASSEAALAAVLDSIRLMDGVLSTETLVYTDLISDVLRPVSVDDVHLDALDLRLLDELQVDGRLTYSELAQRMSVSVGTVRSRVTRMLDSGVVRIGAIDAPGPDRRVNVGLGIRVRGTVREAGAMLDAFPEVRFLAATVGRYDLLATVDCPALGDVVGVLDRVRALRPVTHLDSWVHLESVKEIYRYPIGGEMADVTR